MSLFTLLADILFVGHSLIGPTLPAMVEAGLARQGVPFSVAAQVINGAPLRHSWDHSAEGERADAKVELTKGQTKVLILTEAIPLAAQIQWNDSAAYVAKFAQAAWQMRPDTQVYIYETWHSLKSGPKTEIDGDPGAGTPWRERLDVDLPLWESLTVQANAQRPEGAPLVRLIPGGQAMARLADALPRGEVPGLKSIDQLFDDDLHPDQRALYFLAMVQIATISGQNPAGLPAKLTRHWPSRSAVITDAQAAGFQRIAWQAVQAYRAQDEARIARLHSDQAAANPPDGNPEPEPGPEPTKPTATQPALPTADPAQKTLTEEAAEKIVLPTVPAVPASGPRGIRNPRLSLGLAAVNDWSVQQPFLDVMKTARPWFGHLPGRWGGFEFDQLKSGGYLDTQLWPRSIPPEVTGISTLILTDLPDDADGVAGRYLLTFQGKGKLKLEGRASNLDQSTPGQISFDYSPGEGSVIVTLTETNAADPIRNIVVVRQDHAAALMAGALFNPDWLNRIRGVRGVRFMDWMATNNSALSKLQDRPKPADFSWAINGVPMEIMLSLANELRAEPWFTIPHLAEVAFVRAYAEAARDGLAPGLRAFVEFSNEVWNWQFDQARWADAQCRARWQAQDCWAQFYALRAAEVADIWQDAFGDQARKRLVRVVSTQTGWQGLEDQILNAPLVMAEGKTAPARHFDAYAVTGYFAAGLGSDARRDLVKSWLRDSADIAARNADQAGLKDQPRAAYIAAHRFDLATDSAAVELENGFVTGDTSDTVTALLTTVLPYHAKQAKHHRLQLLMYEGGTHVVGLGAAVDDADLAAFFQHLNYSAAMGELYERLLQGWARISDAPFNAFVDVETPSKWGSWGGLRHLGDENPRWNALANGCQTC